MGKILHSSKTSKSPYCAFVRGCQSPPKPLSTTDSWRLWHDCLFCSVSVLITLKKPVKITCVLCALRLQNYLEPEMRAGLFFIADGKINFLSALLECIVVQHKCVTSFCDCVLSWPISKSYSEKGFSSRPNANRWKALVDSECLESSILKLVRRFILAMLR
jgi:hypothetical protein